jgi:hypothetical protein
MAKSLAAGHNPGRLLSDRHTVFLPNWLHYKDLTITARIPSPVWGSGAGNFKRFPVTLAVVLQA